MAYKIALDAGHGGSDPGAVYEGRQEKDDVLNLTLAVGDILTDRGFDIIYTRTEDVYDTPYQKAQLANESGADFFVSFHRNSNLIPNLYNGVQSLVYDSSGIKYEMAENINKNLAKIGFENKGITERPNLVVLKRTQMPAVLVEVGFINSDNDNALFDEEFDKIVMAIADGITETVYGFSKGGPGHDSEIEKFYKVQVAAYTNKEMADLMVEQLEADGYPAYVEHSDSDGFYRVISGVFSQLDNAVLMEKVLKEAGYDTFIITL